MPKFVVSSVFEVSISKLMLLGFCRKFIEKKLPIVVRIVAEFRCKFCFWTIRSNSMLFSFLHGWSKYGWKFKLFIFKHLLKSNSKWQHSNRARSGNCCRTSWEGWHLSYLCRTKLIWYDFIIDAAGYIFGKKLSLCGSLECYLSNLRNSYFLFS